MRKSELATAARRNGITVRPLRQTDLRAADAVFRLAFGTFIGVPDPPAFAAGRSYLLPRWQWEPEGMVVAEEAGRLVGSCVVNRWGRVGFLGPITVHPDFWDVGVGKLLLESAMKIFAHWHCSFRGLFTFPNSAKHLGLYQRFGFWPRFLTAVMVKPVKQSPSQTQVTCWSDVPPESQVDVLAACSQLTSGIYAGLDLTQEMLAVQRFKLGDTVLLSQNDSLEGLAVCHFGPDTEGGPETCYVKFAAAMPGPHSAQAFAHLLDACESLAAARGLRQVEAGVNTGRLEAYDHMLARGFRTAILGVAMHVDNAPGYSLPGVYALDDWR